MIFDALLRTTKPALIWDLYAFVSGPSRFNNSNPKVRLLDEYFRLLGKEFYRGSINMIESDSFTLSNDFWRISHVNSDYKMCQTYPFALIVPKSIRYFIEMILIYFIFCGNTNFNFFHFSYVCLLWFILPKPFI